LGVSEWLSSNAATRPSHRIFHPASATCNPARQKGDIDIAVGTRVVNTDLQLRLSDLRRLQRESPTSPFAFVSERWSPFTTAGFTWMIERAAAASRPS
jgi:hypothetical protein